MQTSPYFKRVKIEEATGLVPKADPLALRQSQTPPATYIRLSVHLCMLTHSRPKMKPKIGRATCNVTPSNIVETKRRRDAAGLDDAFVDPAALQISSSSD